MNASDQAAIRARNAESLASLKTARSFYTPVVKAKRGPSFIEPLIPAGWNEELQKHEYDSAENELTMRGLRGWWRMMKPEREHDVRSRPPATADNTNEDDWRKDR
jgi:hypothetical protein